MADARVGAAEKNHEQPANLKIKTVGVEISMQIHRKDTSGQAEQWKRKVSRTRICLGGRRELLRNSIPAVAVSVWRGRCCFQFERLQ